MRNSQRRKISLRLDLEGEEAEKAEFLRKQRGLNSYAALARQLIIEAARREQNISVEVPAR